MPPLARLVGGTPKLCLRKVTFLRFRCSWSSEDTFSTSLGRFRYNANGICSYRRKVDPSIETLSQAKRGVLTITVSAKMEWCPCVNPKFWRPMVSMKHLKRSRHSGVDVSLQTFEPLRRPCVTPKRARSYIAQVSPEVLTLAP